ncbi:MAG: TadE/TadG family type IV pilus assembly protein [Nitriliruptoraceae bacterium]
MHETRRCRREDGILSLEAVLVLPTVAVLILGILTVAAVVTDSLLVHAAARAGARVAVTTRSDAAVIDAARAAAPNLEGLQVTTSPSSRRAGDVVRVVVTVDRQVGPTAFPLRAEIAGRVEPGVG